MKDSYVFLAAGFEEIEAVTVIDILRRAGIPVRTVSITASLQVTGAHGITVTCDVLYDNTLFRDAPWLILPGGLPGADNLSDFAPLEGLLRNQLASPKGRIAAICAAPAVVLGRKGLLAGRKATCYPGFEKFLEGAEYIDVPVAADDKFILGNGPANAAVWALAIVEATLGADKSREVAAGMLYYPAADSSLDNMFG